MYYVVVIVVFDAIVVHVVLGASLCSLCSLWDPACILLLIGAMITKKVQCVRFSFFGWGKGEE